MIKDVVGTEVKVGDIVVYTGSCSSQSMGLVTRLSEERVQIEGGGYSHYSSIACVTQQYIMANGQEAYNKYVAKYANSMNHTPVAKKAPSPSYSLVRVIPKHDYYTLSPDDRYFVIMSNGATKGDKFVNCRTKLTAIIGDPNYHTSGFAYRAANVLRKETFIVQYTFDLYTKSDIKRFKLDDFIDQEIPRMIIDQIGVIRG